MPEIIIISKGKQYPCLYDQEDQELISRFSWSLHSQGYAQTTINGKTVLMHRLILGVVDKPDIEVDHRFHNRLDNRRSKIRACTHSQNLQNSRKIKKGSCALKGVYRDQNKWHAQIMIDDRVKNLGRFRSPITAGRIYDQAAKENFKDFACLNFPESETAHQSLILSF